MYKKVSDFEDKINDLYEKITDENLDMDTNPDVFSVLKSYNDQIDDLCVSVSGLRKDIKQQALIALKDLKLLTKTAIYMIYKEHMDEYVMKIQTALIFLIKYPHMFSDETDDGLLNAIRIRQLFWHFLGDYFASHKDPEVFVKLCKNDFSLSCEEMRSIAMVLVKKMFSTLIRDLLEEVSDRDIDRKKNIAKEIREHYPEASNKCNHILLSKSKWNAIQHDFLETSQSAMYRMFNEHPEQLFSDDFHDFMDNFSMLFMSFSDEEQIDKIFTTYVSLFLSEQFQYSEKKNKQKPQNKVSRKEMISSVFSSAHESTNALLPLPEGLSADIRSYLTIKKLNVQCDKLVSVIEKILQKFFTKKQNIRKNRFKNKISSLGFDCIDDDFFIILERYGFVCVDDQKSPSLSSDDVQIVGDFVEKELLSSDDSHALLIERLSLIDTFERFEGESTEEYVRKKVSGYADLFSELGYTYEDKEKFIEYASRHCATNQRLLKDIKKILLALITVNKKEVYRPGRNYYVFTLSGGWRIILYKKGVINILCSHDYYETHLKNNY